MDKLTIRQFAKKIGVSPTTVSRALTGRGRVSEETRQLVLKSMEELGYVPNRLGQQLATGRSQMVLLHHTSEDILADPFLVELARGLQCALNSYGYGLLLDSAGGPGDDRLTLRRWLDSHAVDGVVMVNNTKNITEKVKELASSTTPFVVMDDSPVVGVPHLASLMWADPRGAHQVANMFVGLGHTRIGFITWWEKDVIFERFRERLNELGVDLPDELVVSAGASMESGAKALRKMFSVASPPTAIFVRKDIAALGAMREASRLQLRIPEDLSIVGYDDLPLTQLADPPLTTVRVDCFEVGRLAVEILFGMLDDPNAVIAPRVMEMTSLVIRETVGAVPARAKSGLL